MLVGRRNKENTAGAANGAMERLPKRAAPGALKPGDTPQKLKAEILSKNREIEQLRRLLDQANKGSCVLPSPRSKLPGYDCLEKQRSAMRKVDECISLIRHHSWHKTDQACSQDALDLLQAGLAMFFSPTSTKARTVRRQSISASFLTEDAASKQYENEQVHELKQQLVAYSSQLVQYASKFEASVRHEQEIESVVRKLGEACRLSEARAGEYQAKCESLSAALINERSTTASLLFRVQDAEGDRIGLREDILHFQGEIDQLRQSLAASQRASDKGNAAVIENKILAGKVDKLARYLSREKEFNEVQAHTIERLEKEILNLSRSVDERDDRIRHLVCTSHQEKEAERESLLNRISFANTAVSTLQLELQLNRSKRNGEDSDEEGAGQVEGEGSGRFRPCPSPRRSSRENRRAKNVAEQRFGCEEHDGLAFARIRDRRQNSPPFFLLPNQVVPGYDSFQFLRKCLKLPGPV